MKRNNTIGKGRGYREVVVGSLAGAVAGVLAARLMTVLLVGIWGLADLELRPVPLSNTLMLLLPPLATTTVYAIALRLAGYRRVGSSVLFILLLSPLASWLLWEAQQQLGAAELWPLRIVPVILLTLLAPVAHVLARTHSHHSGAASADRLFRGQR
jgi:hypothetical protein